MTDKICPLLGSGPTDRPWQQKCQEGSCAWWTGSECAVSMIAVGMKPAKPVVEEPPASSRIVKTIIDRMEKGGVFASIWPNSIVRMVWMVDKDEGPVMYEATALSSREIAANGLAMPLYSEGGVCCGLKDISWYLERQVAPDAKSWIMFDGVDDVVEWAEKNGA